MPDTYLKPVGTTAKMTDNLPLTHLKDLFLHSVKKVLGMEKTKETASVIVDFPSYQLQN